MTDRRRPLTRFLAECKKRGFKRVALRVKDYRVPASVAWGCAHSGSAFAWPDLRDDSDTWPAIWGCAERADVHAGCGNSGQVQIRNTVVLPAGYYFLNRNGKWVRKDPVPDRPERRTRR